LRRSEGLFQFEHGRKSPTLATAARLLSEAGFELAATPRITFVESITSRGRVVVVPSALPRLPVREVLARVVLPKHLAWSRQRREYRLADRGDRARVYEMVLREGGPEDVLRYVDGALLVDLWDDLVLPRGVRSAWDPVIVAARGCPADVLASTV
jgi:hypothetical protein